jgi:cyclic-di-GMP phosphodiesterase, flagellum assembly factor TipF
MVRLTAVFFAVWIVLIATSCGVALYFVFGFSGVESLLASVAALTGLALCNTVSSRLRDRADVAAQIADLSRGTADLARQMAELGRRLASTEVKVDTAVDSAVAARKPLAVEIEQLRALIKQLGYTVSVHDAALGGTSTLGSIPTSVALVGQRSPAECSLNSSPDVATAPASDALSMSEAKVAVPPTIDPTLNDNRRSETSQQPPSPIKSSNGRFKNMEHDAIVAMIHSAAEGNHIDLYLQPIVTLPQRKVLFYEGLTRLRVGEGEVLALEDILPQEEEAGLMPRIDNLILYRCVQVLRRLLAKNRELGMFCNVSASTLADSEFFPQFSELMEANRALAPSLVLEFTQSAYRNFGSMENEKLAALASRGFRFSMDNVSDLRLEPRDLGERGFRFLKVPAELLLDRSRVTISDIHPEDLSGLLSRFGVELIAEGLESETVVVDLLDYDVKYGQGFLFSPPRAVRAEIMQTAPERADAAACDAGAAGTARPALTASPLVRNPAETQAATARPASLPQLARGLAAGG